MELLLIVLALLSWFWLDSVQTKELAIGICQTKCRLAGIQFLDETVAIKKLRIRWGADGLCWSRTYGFEISTDNVNRAAGSITMLGKTLEDLNLNCDSQPNARII
ncbi:hypothetical protein TI04_00250 [Achromatium sp. WMS2]|nr:hypothetical protein TI04_00250 [Achromatium sp. WMS2]